MSFVSRRLASAALGLALGLGAVAGAVQAEPLTAKTLATLDRIEDATATLRNTADGWIVEQRSVCAA